MTLGAKGPLPVAGESTSHLLQSPPRLIPGSPVLLPGKVVSAVLQSSPYHTVHTQRFSYQEARESIWLTATFRMTPETKPADLTFSSIQYLSSRPGEGNLQAAKPEPQLYARCLISWRAGDRSVDRTSSLLLQSIMGHRNCENWKEFVSCYWNMAGKLKTAIFSSSTFDTCNIS